MSEMILALYDCRSKQEYIYRTNRIKEITGGSQLLTELYDNLKKQAIEKAYALQTAANGKTVSSASQILKALITMQQLSMTAAEI